MQLYKEVIDRIQDRKARLRHQLTDLYGQAARLEALIQGLDEAVELFEKHDKEVSDNL